MEPAYTGGSRPKGPANFFRKRSWVAGVGSCVIFFYWGGLTSDFDKSTIAIREVSSVAKKDVSREISSSAPVFELTRTVAKQFGIPRHFFCHTTPPPGLADFLTIASDLRISYRSRKRIAEITSFVYMTFSGTCYVEI